MAAAPSVFLVFEGAWLEVEASLVQRRGGLRAFAREAESQWDLQPGSYEFQHVSGKVDSSPSLQHALAGASKGVCKLEIVERLEGKMMRTMRKEMKLLEDRVMAKVETVLADVRAEAHVNEKRLSGCIGPLVQCLAVEQIAMREKLGQLGPLVQCVAVEQIEMREKLGQLGATPNVEKAASDDAAYSLKDAEALEQELQQECAMQAACDLDLSNSDCLEEMREEVCHLGQKETAEAADRTEPAKTASHEGRGTIIDFKHTFGEPDSRLHWPSSAAAIPYSSKLGKGPSAPSSGFEARWHPGDKWSYIKLGEEVTTPFAQSISKSTFGHRSCPLLPPLH